MTECVGEYLFLCVSISSQFYSKNKGSIATTLLKPKQKQGTKSAELELSKSKKLFLYRFNVVIIMVIKAGKGVRFTANVSLLSSWMAAGHHEAQTGREYRRRGVWWWVFIWFYLIYLFKMKKKMLQTYKKSVFGCILMGEYCVILTLSCLWRGVYGPEGGSKDH